MKRLHLLIPCTARKSKLVPSQMNLQCHKVESLDQTVESWCEAFSEQKERIPAKELYLGQAFSKLKKLSEQSGYDLEILSAGFGVVNENTILPSYNATFATNENQVPSPKHAWWTAVNGSNLPGRSFKKTFEENSDDVFVICASNEYLNAIQYDLQDTFGTFVDSSKKVAIISTSIPRSLHSYKHCFIKCSRSVLTHCQASTFGLSLTDRNITTIATHLFLCNLELTKLNFSDTIFALNEEIGKLSAPIAVRRVKCSDDFILSYIENNIFKNDTKPTSATLALKQLKSEGFACTDTRFSTLYNRIKSKKVSRD
ncbi:DUF6884 domain-containing protein [Vibrio renipiscarius]|uniref:DUF6884 domain-containing protein n=1 Tax=Vibrio renipiscarius TaxID=1461322 RepID=UPI00354EEAA5